VKKTRQNKKLEPGSDSVRTGKALDLLCVECATCRRCRPARLTQARTASDSIRVQPRLSAQTVSGAIRNETQIDHFKSHSAPDHFRLKVRDMSLPALGFPDAKSRGLTELVQLIISRERTARAEVHHGQTGVGEFVIIHGGDGFLKRSFFKIISKQHRETVPIPEPMTSLTRQSKAL
jgi:hypothetical protein